MKHILLYSGTPKCGHPEIRTSCFNQDALFRPNAIERPKVPAFGGITVCCQSHLDWIPPTLSLNFKTNGPHKNNKKTPTDCFVYSCWSFLKWTSNFLGIFDDFFSFKGPLDATQSLDHISKRKIFTTWRIQAGQKKSWQNKRKQLTSTKFPLDLHNPLCDRAACVGGSEIPSIPRRSTPTVWLQMWPDIKAKVVRPTFSRSHTPR